MANTKLPARLLDTSAVPILNVTGTTTANGNVVVVGSELRVQRPSGGSSYFGILMDSGEKVRLRNSWANKDIYFDRDGNLSNWWNKDDRDNFDKRTALLANQYSQYEVLPGRTLNGELTLGENIADLGGAKAAFRAYKISLKGEPSPIIDNYTGEQRFFIGTAQSDRVKFRDEIYEMRVATSVHSPSRFRVDGVIINMKEFHKAFSTEKGDKLYKSDNDIILIW